MRETSPESQRNDLIVTGHALVAISLGGQASPESPTARLALDSAHAFSESGQNLLAGGAAVRFPNAEMSIDASYARFFGHRIAVGAYADVRRVTLTLPDGSEAGRHDGGGGALLLGHIPLADHAGLLLRGSVGMMRRAQGSSLGFSSGTSTSGYSVPDVNRVEVVGGAEALATLHLATHVAAGIGPRFALHSTVSGTAQPKHYVEGGLGGRLMVAF